MFQTSQDIFFVVLSFCVLWLTIFLCWLLYYLIMILKKSKATVDIVYSTASSIQEKIEHVGKVIDLVKDKLENTSSYFGLILDNVVRLVGLFERNKTEKKEKKK